MIRVQKCFYLYTRQFESTTLLSYGNPNRHKQHRTLQSLLSRHVGIHTIASHQINGHLPSTYLYQPTDFYISSPFLPKTSSRPLVKLWSKFYLCRKLSREREFQWEREFFFFLGGWGERERGRRCLIFANKVGVKRRYHVDIVVSHVVLLIKLQKFVLGLRSGIILM